MPIDRIRGLRDSREEDEFMMSPYIVHDEPMYHDSDRSVGSQTGSRVDHVAQPDLCEDCARAIRRTLCFISDSGKPRVRSLFVASKTRDFSVSIVV